MKLTERFLAELDRDAPVIEQDERDLTPPAGAGQYQQPAADKLAEVHDANVAKGRAALSRTNDDFLMSTTWRLPAADRS